MPRGESLRIVSRMNRLRHGVLASLIALARLDSNAANPQLKPPVTEPGGLTLQWTSAGETAFTVQTRDSFRNGLWLAAPSSTPWPIETLSWTDPRPMLGERFYRVLAVKPAQRGKLLSASKLAAYSTLELGFIFQLGGVPVTPQQGVEVHKLLYETIDPWGNRTQASGIVVLPQAATKPLAVASYQHGTLAKKSEAPSANLLGERVLGLVFGATGYAGVLPDYLGLGDSPGVAPYHHARSEGSACVDMLRAARSFCENEKVRLNGQLFIAGYSHGGHATMALLREIETYHPDEFTVTAAAPMAGAYDLSGTSLDDFLSTRPQPNPFYAALLLAAAQDVYHIAPSLGDLFTAPYDQKLPPLLAGNHTGDEINAALPRTVSAALKQEFLSAIAMDPDHPLRRALRDNDVYAWRPRSPVRMYHCKGDQDVLKANAEVALRTFQTLGAPSVQLLDLAPSADHGACSEPSLLAAKLWFDSLRK